MTKRKIAPLLIVLLLSMSACNTPKPNNPNPSPLDTPVEVLNGVRTSTRAAETIAKNHHNASRASIKANSTLTPQARKAALTANTASFQKFNSTWKQILQYEREAGDILKTVAASGGSTQTAKDKIKLVAGLVSNELLATIDDPELRASLQSLSALVQQLLGRL